MKATPIQHDLVTGDGPEPFQVSRVIWKRDDGTRFLTCSLVCEAMSFTVAMTVRRPEQVLALVPGPVRHADAVRAAGYEPARSPGAPRRHRMCPDGGFTEVDRPRPMLTAADLDPADLLGAVVMDDADRGPGYIAVHDPDEGMCVIIHPDTRGVSIYRQDALRYLIVLDAPRVYVPRTLAAPYKAKKDNR
ncbi:hypothetical protein [Corynebacterium sp. TAE3-ERU16]|uniref:hypothetical protein n=1 Tax=Corynebacterium sp. TAE3-ERU16 TaxID=2849493 RepID=UPI001C47A854|nr:hypothetical protein [Corynebacterium sp. TAE3-ERU16]MBV7292349.1 hypothetical protein [Corynebacterium sp. TAE3-ERU16]